MAELIKQLCFLSFLCGIMKSLTDESGIKQIQAIVCMLVLSIPIVCSVKSMDYDAYALELAKYREQKAAFLDQEKADQRQLNRLVIEQECETYIMDKAEATGMDLRSIDFEMLWDPEGVWVPNQIHAVYGGEEKAREWMGEIITTEFGIPPERQTWTRDE